MKSLEQRLTFYVKRDIILYEKFFILIIPVLGIGFNSTLKKENGGRQ